MLKKTKNEEIRKVPVFNILYDTLKNLKSIIKEMPFLSRGKKIKKNFLNLLINIEHSLKRMQMNLVDVV